MDYKVIKQFSERYNGDKLYLVGGSWPGDFTPPDGRADALLNGKKCDMNRTGEVYIEAIEKKTTFKSGMKKSDLIAMTKSELQEVAKKNKLELDGAMKKADMVNAILGVMIGADAI